MKIQINEISLDPSICLYLEKTDDHKIELLADLIREGSTLPPVKIGFHRKKAYLIDGIHQIRAEQSLGNHQINCKIVSEKKEYWPLLSFKLNQHKKSQITASELRGLIQEAYSNKIPPKEIHHYTEISISYIYRNLKDLIHREDESRCTEILTLRYYHGKKIKDIVQGHGFSYYTVYTATKEFKRNVLEAIYIHRKKRDAVALLHGVHPRIVANFLSETESKVFRYVYGFDMSMDEIIIKLKIDFLNNGASIISKIHDEITQKVLLDLKKGVAKRKIIQRYKILYPYLQTFVKKHCKNEWPEEKALGFELSDLPEDNMDLVASRFKSALVAYPTEQNIDQQECLPESIVTVGDDLMGDSGVPVGARVPEGHTALLENFKNLFEITHDQELVVSLMLSINNGEPLHEIVRALKTTEIWVKNTVVALMYLYHHAYQDIDPETVANRLEIGADRVSFIEKLKTRFSSLIPDRKSTFEWLINNQSNGFTRSTVFLLRAESLFWYRTEHGIETWEDAERLPKNQVAISDDSIAMLQKIDDLFLRFNREIQDKRVQKENVNEVMGLINRMTVKLNQIGRSLSMHL